ncbi:hypothetical protein IRZ71_22725 [Flavobacterium sp. ANB]|uniref:hypothetical protein n=1 Tax=unclassified Flavobacterium TaxID=196869 RepID=UPI0012B92509|nr:MULTISPECIES: hypothetical protein [unclassified Flavobacterium]MBF4519176.1 hypothetical protein [Flavobacterium sp. ANB]MTD72020.1 hypothetical protein [Flavobacterium sp. LC2016-13]
MQVSTKYSISICCGLILIVGINYFLNSKEKTVPSKAVIKKTTLIEKKESVPFDTTACSDKEVKLFLSEFIKQFSTNKASNINKFIDKTNGLAIFVKDGYYPILSFPNKIDDWIEWFDFKIYDNVEFGKFPEYLGDGEFKKTGFYYVNYQNKFRLDDFDDTYSNRSDEDKKPFRQLEKICNYRADVMSIDKSTVLTLYFSIYKNNKYLVGITQDAVDDVLYTDQEKEFVPIDTEEQVEAFLSNNRRFCDVENKAYVDFDKKELTYYDFDDKPFQFSNYKIGPVNVISGKIKIRDIKFFNSDEEEGFTLKFSNKGDFSSYRMGARPQYIYEKCK